MNLLSDDGLWMTEAEFVTADGTISKASGETRIRLTENGIENLSQVSMGGTTIVNNYEITPEGANRLSFKSTNQTLGIQHGIFDIDRNTLYSRFAIENTALTGFEVIIRDGNVCTANGALYDRDALVNTWTATLRKMDWRKTEY